MFLAGKFEACLVLGDLALGREEAPFSQLLVLCVEVLSQGAVPHKGVQVHVVDAVEHTFQEP